MTSPLSALRGATAATPARVSTVVRGLGAFALWCLGLGIVAGTLWRAIVKLPTYRLDDESHALISELGLAAIFSADAWFTAIGLGGGLIIGVVAWMFFRRWGWRVVALAAGGAVLSALIAWWIGTLLGPGSLQLRLAAADVGDRVPIDLQLHALTALAVWPFGAMVPILAATALRSDPEDPRARRRSRRSLPTSPLPRAADGRDTRAEQANQVAGR